MKLGRYELLELLGQGAFGSVHSARLHGPLGFVEQVAVKVMNPGVAESDPDALPALADEARILSQLRHPNIVSLRGFEAVEHEGKTRHLLVLELVRGVTCDQILRLLGHLNRPLAPAALLMLWDDVLAGLDHAHNAISVEGKPLGLVHRDLKPANLMIDERGNLRILDFGIALAKERNVQTMVGRTKGSPPWMSPEQVQGEIQDGRSDLWVLSTIVFRLLTGEWWIKPATTRDEGVEIFREILRTKWLDRRKGFVAAFGRSGYLPSRRADRRRLEALMASLLDHDMDKRPAGAAEVRAKLRELSTWEPEAGRVTLSRICRGILKGGPGAAPPVNVPTRRMPKVTQLTSPGVAVPRRPATEVLGSGEAAHAEEAQAAQEAALARALFENVGPTSESDLPPDVGLTDELPDDIVNAIDEFTERQGKGEARGESASSPFDPENAATVSLPPDGIQAVSSEEFGPVKSSPSRAARRRKKAPSIAPGDLPEPEALLGFRGLPGEDT